MLVSHTKKFIYTKTAKTAGTTVESYFLPYCLPSTPGGLAQAKSASGYQGPEGITSPIGHPPARNAKWLPHMAARKIRQQTGQKVWDEYFKFCVVRNPFEKMVSGFFYFDALRNGNSNEQAAQEKTTPQRSSLIDLIPADEDPVQRFRGWLINGAIIRDRNKYFIEGKVCVDYFIRFENLAEGIAEVCERVAIPFEESRIRNLKGQFRKKTQSVSDFYDARSTDIIRENFSFELETFGYRLD